MKKYLFLFVNITIVPLILSSVVFGAIKEVTLDWPSATTMWEGKPGFLPCKEAFKLRITEAPPTTLKVKVTIFNSSGKAYNTIALAAPFSMSYEVNVTATNDIAVIITQPLEFHRFYYIKVELTTSVTTNSVSTPNVTVTPSTPTIDIDSSRQNIRITTTTTQTVTTTNPPSSTPNPNAPQSITTTNTTIVTKETKTTDKQFAIPLRSEISGLEFLGVIGDVTFCQSGFKSFDHNVALLAGVKIKVKPVSTNPNIGRFGLYPVRSRFSFVIGTVLSDLSYKTTDIEALSGFKLLGGLDWEFSENVGITLGGVLAKQNQHSKLTDKKPVVVGLCFGISPSTAVFQRLSATAPATAKFPATDGQDIKK